MSNDTRLFYEQLRLSYRIAVPILLLLCVVSILINAVLLMSGFYLRRCKSTLLLTYSLAASDLMTAVHFGIGNWR